MPPRLRQSRRPGSTRRVPTARERTSRPPRCFAQIGSRPDEALTRLRVAKAFAEAGRDADARRELEHAVDFFESVGASAYLREAVLVV